MWFLLNVSLCFYLILFLEVWGRLQELCLPVRAYLNVWGIDLGGNSEQANDTLNDFLIPDHEYRSYHLTQQTMNDEQFLTRAMSNPKLVHSYIGHKKKSKGIIGPLRKDNGTLTSNCADISTLLAEAFVCIFQSALLHPKEHQHCEKSLNNIDITFDAVLHILKNLDGVSSMFSDSVHLRLVKECGHLLGYLLYLTFTNSLHCNQIPSAWKMSTVIPIFKEGSKSTLLNYWPISLTSV